MNDPKVCQPYTDGNPLPVPAHQHPNPDGTVGGWVAQTAHVAADVHVGPRATIEGGNIRGGNIRGGTIWGGTIWGGTIWGGTIEGGTIWGGTIEGGTIEGGTIWGGTIEGGTIWGGTIEGGTIEGGTIRGGTIWGGAEIKAERDILTIGPIGSESQTLTLHRTATGHLLHVGCWINGQVDQLAAEVHRRAPGHADEYAAAEAMCRLRLAEWTPSAPEGVGA